VTLDEAWRELGVGDDAPPDAVRRAYLRLLKTRKPEVDPAGFLRLREAYEMASSFLAWREGAAAAMRRDADLAASAPAEPTGASAAPVAPSPPEPSPGPAAEGEAAPVVPLDLVPVPPRSPSPEQIKTLLKSGDLAGAAPLLTELFDVAATHEAVLVPTPPIVLHVELGLLVAGERARARALDAAFRRWLRESGNDARLFRDQLAAVHLVVRELLALPEDFDDEVLGAIAYAAQSGDIAAAAPKLAALAASARRYAREQAEQLRAHAPALATTLGPVLDPPEPRPSRGRAPASGNGWRWFPFGFIALFAMQILRACGGMSTSDPRPSYQATYEPPQRAPYEPPRITLSPPVEGSPESHTEWKDPTPRDAAAPAFQSAAREASDLQTVARVKRQPAIENLAESEAVYLGAGRCDLAHGGMWRLVAEEKRVSVGQDLLEPTGRLARAVLEACPNPATDGGTP
jgi:hypothetical protein